MITYNSYEAAKIANPTAIIYKASSGSYATNEVFNPELCTVIECNPADHCMTVEKFLADGHKFVEGDVCLRHDGDVITVTESVQDWNMKDDLDDKRYILRAAALEKPTESAVKGSPKRVKVEHVKCELSIGDFISGFQKGLLFYYQGGEYHQIETERQAMFHASQDSYFVKQETEIDERKEFIDAAVSLLSEGSCDNEASYYAGWFESMYDSGKFKLVEGE